MLLWAVAKHSYNYYNWLRFVVSAVAGWGFYRLINRPKKDWYWAIAYFVVLITFNPIQPMTYEKGTWAVIDIVTGLFFLTSIFFIDNEVVKKFLNSYLTRLIGMILSCLLGLGLLLFGGYIIFLSLYEDYQKGKLIYYSKETQGIITSVKHDSDFIEDDQGDGEVVDYYYTEYIFSTPQGDVGGKTTYSENPLGDIAQGKYENIEEDEWIEVVNEKVPITVIYEQGDPQNNAAKENLEGLGSLIFSTVLAIGFAVIFPLNIGFIVLKSSYKDLRELLSNISIESPAQ